MLSAAVDDLTVNGRLVFAVAPTAKAARVLETETRMPADTIAKPLHEHARPDRAPLGRCRLPAGTTLVVDEASMIGTSTLHRTWRFRAYRRVGNVPILGRRPRTCAPERARAAVTAASPKCRMWSVATAPQNRRFGAFRSAAFRRDYGAPARAEVQQAASIAWAAGLMQYAIWGTPTGH
jgi:hypothetical protein